MDLLDAAIEHAAAELPEYWSITIHVEQGSAWVTLTDEHGNDIDLETHYDDVRILAKDVICGTETAMNIARVKPKMSIRELAERSGIDITDIQGEDIEVLTGKRTHND
jgi:hypothetical protein